jgi:hypothetical protein
MTWLLFINKYFLQYFFIRLARCEDKKIKKNNNLTSVRVVDGGSLEITSDDNVKLYKWFSILYWVKPYSGWNSDFIYLNNKHNYLRITKRKPL